MKMNKLLMAVVALVPFTAAEAQKKNLITNKGEIVPMEKFDSAANRAVIDLKLNKADTTGKWVGSLYRRNDSLFYKKNTVETFFTKILTDVVTPGLGEVTDIDNWSNTSISVPSIDIRDGSTGINMFTGGDPLNLVASGISPGGRTQMFQDASGTIALTQDIKNIYNQDGLLEGDRTISGNLKRLTISNLDYFDVTTAKNTGRVVLVSVNPSQPPVAGGYPTGVFQADANLNSTMIAQGYMVNTPSGYHSKVELYRDSLSLKPWEGNLYIDSLKRSAAGSCTMLVWDSVAKRVQYQTLPPVGSGTNNYVAKWTPDGKTIGSGLVYDNGSNVGIGTASPVGKLHVIGNTNLNSSDADNIVSGYANNLSQGFAIRFDGLYATGTNSAVDIKLVPKGSGYLYAGGIRMLLGNPNTLYFGSTNPNFTADAGQNIGIGSVSGAGGSGVTTGININTTSGYVGIGTSTPLSQLSIHNTVGGNDEAITFTNSAIANGKFTLKMNSNDFYFQNNGGINHMKIEQAGNIGVGSTAPYSKFHVKTGASTATTSPSGTVATFENNSHAYLNLLPSSGGAAGLLIGNGSNNQITALTYNRVVSDAWDITKTTAGTTSNLVIQNSNNSNGASNANLTLQVGGTGSGDAWVNYTIPGSVAWSTGVDNSDLDKWKLSSGGTPGNLDLLTVTTTGEVGIGTTSPTARLHITQTTPASVATTTVTAVGNPLTILGANGGATSSSGSTVTAGNSGNVAITTGNGGAITGAPTTGIGGNAGEIRLLGGDGGLGTTFGGNGGAVEMQGGNGGGGTNGGAPGYASFKGGNAGSTGNANGGNVFIVGGIKNGTGQDGTIFLGVSPSFTVRSNTVIGSATDDNVNKLQVTGNSKFDGLVILKAYTVATLPTGVAGAMCYVTDATSSTYNSTLTGGGSVTVPVFYNGAAWVAH